MIDDSVNDMLNSGNPYAKFLTIGTTVRGTVLHATSRQETDFDTKKPLFWDDGNPRMQLVITLQTEDRDPEIAGDTGLRDLYVKANMLTAVREALKVTKVKLEVGGTLGVRYTGDGTPSKRGLNPPKLYEAGYKPPVAQPGSDLLGDTPVSVSAAAPNYQQGGQTLAPPASTQPAAADLV